VLARSVIFVKSFLKLQNIQKKHITDKMRVSLFSTTQVKTFRSGEYLELLAKWNGGTRRGKLEGCGFDSRWRLWDFSLSYSFRPHYCPGVVSASNKNEYKGYFLVGKGDRCVRPTTLPPSCAECLEILGPSTCWSPKDLSRPVEGYLSRNACRSSCACKVSVISVRF
jgi:hypothetical protein